MPCHHRHHLYLDHHRVNYKNSRVQEMLVMGSLLSKEEDMMSAMRHRMTTAVSAMRAEMYFNQNPGIPREENTRDTSRLRRPACCTRREL